MRERNKGSCVLPAAHAAGVKSNIAKRDAASWSLIAQLGSQCTVALVVRMAAIYSASVTTSWSPRNCRTHVSVDKVQVKDTISSVLTKFSQWNLFISRISRIPYSFGFTNLLPEYDYSIHESSSDGSGELRYSNFNISKKFEHFSNVNVHNSWRDVYSL